MEDFDRSLNYFKIAQRFELEGQIALADELYARSLSIRYAYPKSLIEPGKVFSLTNHESGLEILPDNVLPLVFMFLDWQSGDVLSTFSLRWLLSFRDFLQRQRCQELPQNDQEKFIPQATICAYDGHSVKFKFSDVDFFDAFQEKCMKVAVVYAFCLVGQKVNSSHYIARYNPVTKSVTAVDFYELLADVFYERPSYGQCYRIDACSCDSDIQTDFLSSVDDSFLNNGGEKHDPRILGKVHFSGRARWTGEDSYEFLDSDAEAQREEEGEEVFDVDAARLRAIAQNNCAFTVGSDEGFVDGDYEVDCQLDVMNIYHERVKYASRHILVGVAKFVGSKRKKFNLCTCSIGYEISLRRRPKGDDDDDYESDRSDTKERAVFDEIKNLNHLIFDFDKMQLKVEPIIVESIYRCNDCDLALFQGQENYRVSIEELARDAGGFNHASCQCNLPAELEFFSFADYPLLSHVHVNIQRRRHVSPGVEVDVNWRSIVAL
eukprot:TRINITY_DN4975_c0_g1_i7.p1 TRINITY_DN4975_c0_g1~~TRINITY_DN4975_c0_g1_i7.p1  ORF type:complete len:491 (+),score=112.55 TRINITY_DN4975_c0_g1_i7:432-1904(+)